MKKTIFLSIMILLLTACQDYLETNPDSTLDVQIDSEDKIAELLTGAIPKPVILLSWKHVRIMWKKG